MNELDQYFCPNEQCKDYGLRRQGNITVGKHTDSETVRRASQELGTL